MHKQKIEIEVDMPDGYEFAGYGPPRRGDWCLFREHAFDEVRPFQASVDWKPHQSRILLRKIEPETRVVWINVYPAANKSDMAHESRELADSKASPSRIACVEVKYEVPRTA